MGVRAYTVSVCRLVGSIRSTFLSEIFSLEVRDAILLNSLSSSPGWLGLVNKGQLHWKEDFGTRKAGHRTHTNIPAPAPLTSSRQPPTACQRS